MSRSSLKLVRTFLVVVRALFRNKDSNYWRKAAKEKVRVYWSNLKASKKKVGVSKATTSSRGRKRPGS